MSVIRCLAFDCSCGALSIAVAERRDEATATMVEWRETLERGHDARLLPAIDETLRRAGLRLADLHLLAVTVGPGSFTGVRIGLATARALAQATGLPLAGQSTLAVLLAMAAVRGSGDEAVAAAIDTKRGDAYLQVHPGPQRPFVGDASALRLAVDKPAVLLVGDAAPAMQGDLERLGLEVRRDPDIIAPDAGVLAALTLEQGVEHWRERMTTEGLPRPLYLRAAAVTLPDGTRTTAG